MQQLKHLAVLLFLATPAVLSAQQKHNFTISGTVKDKKTGETLIGAAVSFLEQPTIGVVTNSYGFYSLAMPPGKYTVLVSYAGYTQDTVAISLEKDVLLNINMRGAAELKEVLVHGTKGNDITHSVAGMQRLTMKDIENVPVLFGEKDVLKTIQLLPGIKSAGDGKAGFFVRGGSSDQNLILLDEAPVYNASHLLGFFSVFNSDAIKDITIYKGGMPASYGGRLSSIEDIQMNDGNNQKYGVSGGIGLISSRLNVEGPIVKDKGSFTISARRTYADAFLGLSSDTTIKGSTLYFYDVNAKANYNIDDKNKIYLSGYTGKDVLGLKDKYGVNWGNTTGTLRWNHIFNSRLFSNTSLIYSDFAYDINFINGGIDIKSHITDYHLKQDFNYYINTNNKLDFGVDVIYHIIAPGAATATQTSQFNNITLQQKYALESAAYISDEWTIMPKLKLIYGVRFSDFHLMGPGTFYTYDAAGNIKTSAVYSGGKSVANYFTPEPRIAANYQLNEQSSVKLAYDRNVQNIHLLNNTTSSNPNSLYIPTSNNVLPEIADQLSAGYYRNLHNNDYECSAEIYYKALQNQIDYKDGAILLGNDNVESQLLYGTGRAYGLETFFKKKHGKLTGWVSYTLSRTERKIPGINNGAYYPASQDQTHNIAIVGMYQVSKKWMLSADWVYNTGNAVSWPSGKYDVNGQPIYLYENRNGYRMPAYNRLDVGATWTVAKTEHFESSWTFSIYNAYNRANPYSIGFQQDPSNPAMTQAVQTTLFKIVPSITYNFKF